MEVSKLPPERVRQAFNRGRETLPPDDGVIHLTAEDMKAIETVLVTCPSEFVVDATWLFARRRYGRVFEL